MSDGAVARTHTGMVLAGLARDPDRVAIRYGEQFLSARQCLDTVHRTARALLGAGLDRGDGVTVLAGNRPEVVLLRLAANLIGCRVTLLSPDLSPTAQVQAARDALTAAFAFDPGRFGTVADGVARALPSVLLLSLGPGGTDAGTGAAAAPGPLPRRAAPTAPLLPVPALDLPALDLAALVAESEPGPVAPRYRPEDVMAVRFTGGTTGRPKGVVRRFARPPRPELPAASVFLLCTALCHGGGTTVDLALAAGGSVVLQEGFRAADVLAAVARHQVSRVYLPPHLLYRLLDEPALGTTDTGSLRRVGYTGSRPSPERLAEATRRLGPVLHQTYSLTECGPVTRLTPREHLDARLLTTAGRPLPDTEVRIVDEAGGRLPPGRTGRILVRTPTVMAGYWRDPELTAQVLRDGWLHTGDLGSLDEHGYLTVVGRRGPMAVVDAHNVFPRDVEEPLLAHPDVREAVMFATTGPDLLERVHAAVVTAPGSPVTADGLRRWVLQRHGPLHVPSTVLVLPAIPLRASGKPDLAALRTLVARGR